MTDNDRLRHDRHVRWQHLLAQRLDRAEQTGLLGISGVYSWIFLHRPGEGVFAIALLIPIFLSSMTAWTISLFLDDMHQSDEAIGKIESNSDAVYSGPNYSRAWLLITGVTWAFAWMWRFYSEGQALSPLFDWHNSSFLPYIGMTIVAWTCIVLVLSGYHKKRR